MKNSKDFSFTLCFSSFSSFSCESKPCEPVRKKRRKSARKQTCKSFPKCGFAVHFSRAEAMIHTMNRTSFQRFSGLSTCLYSIKIFILGDLIFIIRVDVLFMVDI